MIWSLPATFKSFLKVNLFVAPVSHGFSVAVLRLKLACRFEAVRYEAVNAMLLNEFLKEHRKVQELEKQIQALTATVQK